MNRLWILRSIVIYMRRTTRTITVIMILVCISITILIIWFFSSSSFSKKFRLSFRKLKLLSRSLKLFNKVTKKFNMDSILLLILAISHFKWLFTAASSASTLFICLSSFLETFFSLDITGVQTVLFRRGVTSLIFSSTVRKPFWLVSSPLFEDSLAGVQMLHQ